ncbi:MAG: methylmalonyl-CoA epimerase [Halobacteriales archaeon]
MQLHHIGIATEDLDALADLYAALLAAPVAHEETLEGTRVAFLESDGSYLELLEPGEEGVVATFLEEHGPGIHHLAFETSDIDTTLSYARELGVELVDEKPRSGAWDHEVAFLHPESTGGVLIELVQE